MGGHGGLNILPQKRWNVYNRDNRLKVAQDEAKAKKQEDEQCERHEQAEREHRHRLLLQRTAGGDAAQGDGGAGGEPAGALEHINFWKEEETKLQHPENEKQQRDELKRRGNPDFYTSDAKFDERFALAYGLTGEKPWYAQVQKPERDAAASIAAAVRPVGRVAALPGLAGCSLPGSVAVEQAGGRIGQSLQDEGLRGRNDHRSNKRARRANMDGSSASTSTSSESSSASGSSTSDSDSTTSDSSSSDSSSDTGGGGQRRRRRGSDERKRRRSSRSASQGRRGGSSDKRRHRRRRRRSSSSRSSRNSDDSGGRRGDGSKKHSHRRSHKSSKSKSKSKRHPGGGTAAGNAASKSIEQLRTERLQREKEERMKQRGLLTSTALLPDGPPEKEFNSAFGHAAALKRRRMR